MTHLYRSICPAALLALAGLLLFIAPAAAQSDRYPLEIKNVLIGLPAGAKSGQVDQAGGKQNIFKAGSFTPVWVWVDCKKDYDAERSLFLSVEGTDADETSTVATVPLPRLAAGDSRTGYELNVIPYLKPGNYISEVRVTIRDAAGRDYCAPFQKSSLFGSKQSATAILSIGSPLAGFRLSPIAGPGNQPETDSIRDGAVVLAQCLEPNQLPDSWIGYQGFDLVVLCTGSDGIDAKFFTKLAAEKARLSALREWVLRGGKLLVGVGSNPEFLALIPEIRDILPAAIPATSKRSADSLRIRWLKGDFNETLSYGDGAEGKIAVSRLEARPDRSYRTVIPAERNDGKSTPLMVEAAFGTGRVFAAAFDFEKLPFPDAKIREKFWEGFFHATDLPLASGEENANFNRFSGDDSENLANSFQSSLDYFEGVPVVSFGWVALFILLYIALIGPVDYFVLKKVFKRLEWTWLTFPAIVVAVSATAYFAAYAIKGRDIKINKVDLVQIDLGSNRAVGHSWFSVFSPRIQNYTIGIEPAGATADAPGWTDQSAEVSSRSTVMSWTGTSRGGRDSMLRRSYSYAPTLDPADGRLHPATGLQNVPIQVWSTKAFEGEWMVPLSEKAPLVEAELRRTPANPDVVVVKLKSNLPIEKLDELHMFYLGKDYPLESLVRGEERTFTLNAADTNAEAESWLKTDSAIPADTALSGRRSNGTGGTTPVFRLWPFLFHDLMFGTQTRAHNAGFRRLDQSWRAGRDSAGREAVLVGRIRISEGPAEEWTTKPSSPTKLWLNAFPGQKDASGKPVERKPLLGTLRQDTTIVVTIPVRDSKK